MGYKGTPFFSNDTYCNLLKPYHKKAVNWAHNKGIKTRLHSCGDIMPLLDEIIDTGVDALNPLEVKAGMDVFDVKRKYGRKIVLHGGINAVLWDDKEKIKEEIKRVVPKLKEIEVLNPTLTPGSGQSSQSPFGSLLVIGLLLFIT